MDVQVMDRVYVRVGLNWLPGVVVNMRDGFVSVRLETGAVVHRKHKHVNAKLSEPKGPAPDERRA